MLQKYNPEYHFLIEELKLKNKRECFVEMNYKQLENFYNHYNIKNFKYEPLNKQFTNILNVIYKYKNYHSSSTEKITWLLNIKNTYESLSKITFIKFKNPTIYFEYLVGNNRIDTLIEYKNNFIIIEYSFLKNISLKLKLEQKQEQISNYKNKLQAIFPNKKIYTTIFLSNEKSTIIKSIKIIKKGLK